jgi:hypothetical protein
MVRMNGAAYKLLGYVAWQGGKWYLRQRLPSSRTLALSGLLLAGALGGAVVLSKRLSG